MEKKLWIGRGKCDERKGKGLVQGDNKKSCKMGDMEKGGREDQVGVGTEMNFMENGMKWRGNNDRMWELTGDRKGNRMGM